MKISIVRKFIFLFFLFTINFSILYAEGTQVVSNSRDWHDVYSSSIFANLNGYDFSYVLSEEQSVEVLQTLDSNYERVLLVEPKTNNFISGYAANIRTRNFQVFDTIDSDDFIDNNIELAKMSGVKNYIIIDSKMGYNAVSVSTYAIQSKSFVLFSTGENDNEIIDLIKDADNVLLYGPLSRDSRTAFEPYTTDVINERSKYQNNMAILTKLMNINPFLDLVFTSGEVIEPEIIDGSKPVMLIGKNALPEGIVDYIEENQIKVGILIGVESQQNARLIREQTGIQVFVKFAKGINQVQRSLDIMSVDHINSNISINGINYNQQTGELEVVIENLEDSFVFVKISIDILKDGQVIGTIGGDEILFLNAHEKLTKTYPLEIDDPNVEYKVNSILLFGEDEYSLDNSVSSENKVLNFISVQDDSNIEIKSVKYNIDTSRFEIEVSNLNLEKDVNTIIKIINFIVDGEEESYSSDVINIVPDTSKIIKIKADLRDIDFEDNDYVNLRISYGESPERMVKLLDGNYEYEVLDSTKNLIPIALGMGAFLILLMVVLMFVKVPVRK